MIEQILTHSPALAVAIPLLGAFLTPLVGKISDKLRNIFVVFITALTSVIVLMLSYNVLAHTSVKLAPDLVRNGMQTYVFGAQSLTDPVVRIIFQIDGLNAFVIIIAAILPLAAVLYSWSFMKDETGQDKYYALILLLTAGMLGMMMTGDLFNFFVFLEITSIAAAALIAYRTNNKFSVQAAFKYIVVSTIGALFFLFAVAILYGQYGALNMAVIANNIQYGLLDKIALALIVAALAMKSGIAPMHMWLPEAYGRAPSSVTVVIIGATLGSFYGILRIGFTVYGNYLISASNLSITLGWMMVGLAVLTIFIGVLMAVKQNDFKKMIGFVAVAEIGYMLLAFGAALASIYPDPNTGAAVFSPAGITALKGGVFHILNDALDISLLFLVAGAIYYVSKESSLNKLGGLARNMKYTTVFFIIGLIAVSGLPPLNGFASKLMIYQSTYEINPIIAIVAILCSILMLAAFVKAFHAAFLGPKLPKFEKVREVPKSMLISMFIIAGIIIFIGLFPNIVVENIVNPAVAALQNASTYIGGVI
jgi:multicomponent Na+:H+ antiporter subunit D